MFDVVATQAREIQSIQIGKEKAKVSLFVFDRTLYIRDPKNSPNKLIKILKEAGYKINTKISSLSTYQQ